MTNYVEAKLEIVSFDSEDVITTSTIGCEADLGCLAD